MRLQKTCLSWFPITLFVLFLTPAFTAGAIEAKDIPRISALEAQQLQQQEKVTFIDTRRADQWRQATDKIRGAIRVTTYSELHALQKAIPSNQAIVAYCT